MRWAADIAALLIDCPSGHLIARLATEFAPTRCAISIKKELVMTDYFYNKKLNILETRTAGILTISDITNHYIKLTTIENLTNNLKVLIDC